VLDVDVSVGVLLEARTVARLAERLEDARAVRSRVRAVERPQVLPLSFPQRQLWFMQQLEGPSPTYNMPFVVRLSGELDVPALRAALGDVVLRHEVLRTVLLEDAGVPRQVVLDPVDVDLPVVRVGAEELEAAVLEAVGHRFDLRQDRPLRVTLFSVGEGEWVLVLLLHHIAADGWSMGPLFRDLSAAYSARVQGHSLSREGLPVQYADFALWQQQWLGAEGDPDSVLARQVEYWRATLDGAPEELTLPLDRMRPATPTNRGAWEEFSWDAELHAALLRLARDTNATPFMVIHAAVVALLSRLTGSRDIPIGTPVAGRPDESLDELVGFFVNQLPLRVKWEGDPTFGELVQLTRAAALAGYDHQDLPFERLVEIVNPERSASHHPLFQVVLNFDGTDRPPLDLPGLTAHVD
ncbi:condensation domain-containing protein, partial [Streptomyces griseofuscus]|uniref:condensation domain-containing protein n=1 Tax=Streptomyces griseofuscus TaxID=146922 RepID=UPI00368B8BFB